MWTMIERGRDSEYYEHDCFVGLYKGIHDDPISPTSYWLGVREAEIAELLIAKAAVRYMANGQPAVRLESVRISDGSGEIVLAIAYA